LQALRASEPQPARKIKTAANRIRHRVLAAISVQYVESLSNSQQAEDQGSVLRKCAYQNVKTPFRCASAFPGRVIREPPLSTDGRAVRNWLHGDDIQRLQKYVFFRIHSFPHAIHADFDDGAVHGLASDLYVATGIGSETSHGDPAILSD
jgi:hypothetical protein